jgi:hypothetical protein
MRRFYEFYFEKEYNHLFSIDNKQLDKENQE